MGAWNTKPFGNDTALDWLWELEKAKDDSVLKSALEAVLDTKEPPDAPACEEAVAAAAVIESARRDPIRKLPENAKQWISEQGFVPSDALLQQAIKVVERIARQSELRELWEGSPSFAKWQKENESLWARLRGAQRRPPPTRKPKPLSARLSLPKLIEKTAPDDESHSREKLRKKLEAIVDVNAPLDRINPPLALVAAQGLLTEAERLIERGAKANPEQTNPLIGIDPLAAACAHGHAKMAELLLEHGAQIYLERELGVFPHEKSIQPVKRVFRIPSALYRAVESGDVATVEVLVRHGADLRDTNAKQEALRCHALHYESLLHRAAGSLSPKSPEMIEYLVKRGAELDAKDSLGDTPLKHAALRRCMDSVRRLLELGADVNARDEEGSTPLDLVDDQESDIATLLRQYGGRLGKEV